MLLLTSSTNIKSIPVFLVSVSIIFRGFAAEIIKRASAVNIIKGLMKNNLDENDLII
jgi:hypothetical protein